MSSGTFDTWVDFFSAAGPLFGFDEDEVLGQVQNSQLDIIPRRQLCHRANSSTAHHRAYTLSTETAARRDERLPPSLGRAGRDRERLADRGRLCRQRVTPHNYDVHGIQLVQTRC